MRKHDRITVIGLLVALTFMLPYNLLAQSEEGEDSEAAESSEDVEELVVIGSRSRTPRTVDDSTAPIDFFDSDELTSIGNTADVTDALRSIVPYFNASMASGDGDTFVRPTSLRGLAPDQHLVLVNGVRRHRAALIAEFVPAAGKGAHGPNIGMIPSIAIDNIQILRDGASAQYGADAISGVMNFQTKKANQGGILRTQFGSFFDGERNFKVDGNVGLQLGTEGFVNLSFERNYNQAHSRGVQRPDALALINNGVRRVGLDSPFEDKGLAQTWGRPRHEALLLFVTAGHPISDTLSWYMQGNLAQAHGRYRFFYRGPTHSTLTALAEEGFTGLPQGFTPYFDGETDDYSVVVGAEGELDDDWFYDVNFSVGNNIIDFTLYNTINPSIGLNAAGEPLQRDFDVGALGQTELVVNGDLRTQYTEKIHVTIGGEWRSEEFRIFAGEATSYEGLGSSGFKGFSPDDEGDYERQNMGAFIEVERDDDNMLWQLAARYERYSDFGENWTGKAALRYHFDERITSRFTVSTGFHAPTPGQGNIQKVTTTFDTNTGGQTEQGFVRSSHPFARQAGGKKLGAETSLSYTWGTVFNTDEVFANSKLSVDIYQIRINDRIYKTQTLPVLGPGGIQTNVSFFTNALDIQSSGIDLVYTAPVIIEGIPSDLSIALSHNEVEVLSQSAVNGVLPVPAADIEDIENSYPNLKIVGTSTTTLNERWSMILRGQYYGSHYDERGVIGGAPPTKELDATFFVDFEARFKWRDDVHVKFGLINAFDTYVDTIGEPYANRLNVGLPYARRTAANFEGGSYYGTIEYLW